MSAPKPHLSGTGKPPPEKSKFVQTCNRLSLFLKEKGSIRDLNFGINTKFDSTGVPQANLRQPQANPPAKLPEKLLAKPATVDLLSGIDNPSEKAEKSLSADVHVLPHYVILDSSCEVENSTNKANNQTVAVAVTVTKPKPKTAQMTIFYEGEVVVIDDVPADRARDLMRMAKTGRSDEKSDKSEKRVEFDQSVEFAHELAELPSTSKPPVDVSGSKQPIKPTEIQAKDSDLPIARRASLHKFLAKRKDRATARAPYQVHVQSPGGSSSGNEHSFDLNL